MPDIIFTKFWIRGLWSISKMIRYNILNIDILNNIVFRKVLSNFVQVS